MCTRNYQNLNYNIEKYGGANCLRLSRLWEKTMMKVVKYKEHVTFNKKCYDNEIIPDSLKVKSFDNIPASHRAAKICSLTFVKNRINHAKKKLNYLTRKANNYLNDLSSKLSSKYIKLIKLRAEIFFERMKVKTRLRQKKKFSKLTNNHLIQQQFNTNQNQTISSSDLSDSWVINLSKRSFTQAEIQILKLDPKFQISPKHISSEQIIANIESKLDKIIQDKSLLEKTRISLINAINNKHIIKPNITKDQINAIKKTQKLPRHCHHELRQR